MPNLFPKNLFTNDPRNRPLKKHDVLVVTAPWWINYDQSANKGDIFVVIDESAKLGPCLMHANYGIVYWLHSWSPWWLYFECKND